MLLHCVSAVPPLARVLCVESVADLLQTCVLARHIT
jgi:hypothetical protein